jgi:hypothetical protein
LIVERRVRAEMACQVTFTGNRHLEHLCTEQGELVVSTRLT